MNRYILSLLFSLSVILPSSGITLKLASPFPEGTEWHRSLSRMSREWNDVSDGRVRIKIYPGGIAGTQGDVIRKMRFGQIDMTILTSSAMASIVPKTHLLTLPFYLTTEEELDFALREIAPSFQEDFLKKGFRVLGWSKSGWINFFSKEKILTPENLKGNKLLISPDTPAMINAFKEMGFNVIPQDINNTLMALQSGMGSSFYATPLGAAAYQWFALAKNMLDMKVAPMVGGIMISQRTWKKIPQKFHSDLQASVEGIAKGFYEKTKKLDDQAIRVMKENGLQIHKISQDTLSQWKGLVGENYSFFVGPGRILSRALFDDYRARVEAFRVR